MGKWWWNDKSGDWSPAAWALMAVAVWALTWYGQHVR